MTNQDRIPIPEAAFQLRTDYQRVLRAVMSRTIMGGRDGKHWYVVRSAIEGRTWEDVLAETERNPRPRRRP